MSDFLPDASKAAGGRVLVVDDELLNRSRNTLDTAGRIKIFATLAAETVRERPIVYLYHRNWLWAYNKKLTGMRTIPDGLIRVQGLKM